MLKKVLTEVSTFCNAHGSANMKGDMEVMKIYREESLREFEFWSGAKYTAKVLTNEQLDEIESLLEIDNPDGMSETEINDFFWFEEDTIAYWLGFGDFEALRKHNEGNEDEEEE